MSRHSLPSNCPFLFRFALRWIDGSLARSLSRSFGRLTARSQADVQRKNFREANGKGLIWGKPPVFVAAKYDVIDAVTGEVTGQRKSLLLASGFWGIARHFHYVFELTAAWSWCLLANPFKNGALPLFYAVFLTM